MAPPLGPEILLGDRGDDELQIVLVDLIEGIKLITVDVENEFGVTVVHQRHDDLRFREDTAGDMPGELFNIRYQKSFLRSG